MTEALEPEIVNGEDLGDEEVKNGESVEQPAKVVRVGTMMRQLLEEVKSSPLDSQSRERLKEIYQSSITELGSALSEDLRDELNRLASHLAVTTLQVTMSFVSHKLNWLVGWKV